jgi:hypothetical protein
MYLNSRDYYGSIPPRSKNTIYPHSRTGITSEVLLLLLSRTNPPLSSAQTTKPESFCCPTLIQPHSCTHLAMAQRLCQGNRRGTRPSAVFQWAGSFPFIAQRTYLAFYKSYAFADFHPFLWQFSQPRMESGRPSLCRTGHICQPKRRE